MYRGGHRPREGKRPCLRSHSRRGGQSQDQNPEPKTDCSSKQTWVCTLAPPLTEWPRVSPFNPLGLCFLTCPLQTTRPTSQACSLPLSLHALTLVKQGILVSPCPFRRRKSRGLERANPLLWLPPKNNTVLCSPQIPTLRSEHPRHRGPPAARGGLFRASGAQGARC